MAGDLEAGNQLESQDGTPVTVTALTPTLEVATVYNLTIADLHTYYVTPERDRDDGTASTGL
jgi:hypothetical protein